ncbi:hypothetical protein LTR17_021819 [Elasticomyces elasticus]|nr:hypothetical protein LTR17_021819 [Elasticomyces elasticus]
MASSKRIHWHAPTSMSAALFCAVALSLGHHFFYASLKNQLTPAGSYHVVGKSMSKQQLNTAIGTAFAFLVKATLTVAITLAYTQVFCHTVNSAKKNPTLAELDTLSALGNIVGLFNVIDRWRHPLLFVMALIFWCAPIATIITPATLSVSIGPRTTFSAMDVPQFDFTTLSFSSKMLSSDDGAYMFGGSSQSVQKIAAAVLAQGQALPIKPPSLNASWTLEFWGPALQCQEVQGADRDAIWVNIWNSYRKAKDSWAFLAWTPHEGGPTAPRVGLPFVANSSEPTLYPAILNGGVDMGLYLAVLPNMLQVTPISSPNGTNGHIDLGFNFNSNSSYCDLATVSTFQQLEQPIESVRPSVLFDEASLLQCSLVNTSYSVAFNYKNGEQVLQVLRNTTRSSPPVSALDAIYLNDAAAHDPDTVYKSNQTSKAEASCNSLQGELHAAQQCFVDPVPLQQVAYQSIFMAFAGFITGTVPGNLADPTADITTMLLRTVLVHSKEMAAMRAKMYAIVRSATGAGLSDLQSILQHTNQSTLQGLANDVPERTQGNLKDLLEKAFENITISLLSDPELQPNVSSQFAPSLSTNVRLEGIANFYVYDQVTLWIAYGLAILFATLAVVAGLVFLFISGASYDTTFSTIVRVANVANLTVDLKDDEGTGYQPLPERLAKARLVVGSAHLPPSAQFEMHERRPKRQQASVESSSLLAASEQSSVRNRRQQS